MCVPPIRMVHLETPLLHLQGHTTGVHPIISVHKIVAVLARVVNEG